MDNNRKKKITRRDYINTTAMTTAALGITSTMLGFLKPAKAAIDPQS